MPQYQVYFDTLSGEQRYRVDIGDDELLEQVLRDILVELTENGHMMKGLSAGDLKVVWGGGSGRELDLSLSLPAQGVRPNDVLRVLVEDYHVGAARQDRIDREWRLLGRLAELNTDYIELLDRQSGAQSERFLVRLHNSPGLRGIAGGVPQRSDTHTLRLEFTRFYPDVPIECYSETPIFHPNVKPETGFVCLWERSNPSDTVIQAVARAQAMAAYRMVNLGEAHVMNTEAATWFRKTGQSRGLVPLSQNEVRVYSVQNGQIVWLEPGRDLVTGPKRRLS
jgi:hypothetical protein